MFVICNFPPVVPVEIRHLAAKAEVQPDAVCIFGVKQLYGEGAYGYSLLLYHTVMIKSTDII